MKKKMIIIISLFALIFSMTGCVSKEDKALANNVNEMISNLENGEYASEDIEKVKDEYALLTDKQKSLVENYSSVNEKEKELETLNIEKTQKVMKLIDSLSTSKNPTQEEIDKVNEQYNSLTKEQKALVENGDKLSTVLTEPEQWAYNYCEGLIKQLKNPESFILNEMKLKDAREKTNFILIEINYSAQNGFGGNNKKTYYGVLDKDGQVSSFFGFTTADSVMNEIIKLYIGSDVEEVKIDVDKIMKSLGY